MSPIDLFVLLIFVSPCLLVAWIMVAIQSRRHPEDFPGHGSGKDLDLEWDLANPGVIAQSDNQH